MASFDSTAEFKAAMVDVGLGDLFDQFSDKGIDSFSCLAYMSSYQPGGDPKVFDEEVLKVLLGDPKDKHAPRLRRLYSDAVAMAAHRMRRRMTATSDDPPQKLGNAERDERMQRFRKEYRGQQKGEEFEPSHRLIDAAYALLDTNAVIYLHPEVCTTRRQELDNAKKVPGFTRDAKGYLRESEEKDHGNASIGGLTRLRQALHRRAVALHIAGVIAFESLEAWHDDLLAQLQEPPEKGYESISIDRALSADRAMWRRIARECEGGRLPGLAGGMGAERGRG